MRQVTPVDRRIFPKLTFGDPGPGGVRCLEWTGAANPYGIVNIGKGNGTRVVHRWLYERWVRPLERGEQLHHLCHNHRCCNPEHLEPLTASEHTKRHIDEHGPWAHCPAGHLYDDENTYVHPTKGYKCCRTCHRLRQRDRIAAGKVKPTPKRGPIYGRICEGCGGEIPPMARIDRRFCDPLCRSRHGKRRRRAA